MAAVKIAINGFGRIGRLAFRLMADNPEFEVVAINDLTDPKTLAYLLKFDTAQGRFKMDSIEATENGILVDGKEIKIYSERNAADLPWKALDVDVVLECTGFYVSKEKSQAHIDAGAKKVVISAPASGDLKTIVFNVNDDVLTGEETIISGASCTTNCLAPVVNVLNKEFGLVKGFMTTIHAYTNDQNILDAPHSKDINARRGRAGAANMVPTSTGAAVAVGKVLPELLGKLDGGAVRVPTVTGSCVDLVVELEKNVTAEEINAAMKAAANETLGYTEEPIVSSDCIGIQFGSWFDAQCTKVMTVEGKQLVKILTWYDNEMSYTAQLIRTCKKFAQLAK
ncbi:MULTISPECIES: type I glyceraldehyde-3-phosphate dehydrogenase [Psychrilyobacter]|uniref:Glyceraldehyde-3-phosphate dehydrogenase n=1 Tax=Psychrilyobacter piezotolerans TaxID=2293438 RepID=A0ABX9KDI7_9FUSO|nr:MULTISPECIES: type I glyceraldehyde-3-phosphate dehydrogenase [Psychrilyobacter]MCS5422579.1 type I glyceraldehyde-3-phosphate dehydrogenase [Psychrilyobacter sp. S5]NDI79052.1 type I glyceraldehyde-3-phosphate dehydrogenase [Psychrilyobacter piezotolerans]RDE59052.1 type I glyceraldehyde-3-phosphate dehydrogenase [Psychrilyobacter sp. S5]REI39631.1 type I glyceraldehyde-3-phosphate dehydrogenase [Psychrilyobacter piezotolerans]